MNGREDKKSNDLFYTCGLIAYIVRKTHNHPSVIMQALSAKNPEHDGKQTPMKGHPVFLAQHATACCCRSWLEKWHHIPAGIILTESEQSYIVDVLMQWIEAEINR